MNDKELHDPHQEEKGRRTLEQIHKSSVGIKEFEIAAWNEGYKYTVIKDFIEHKILRDGDKADK